MKTCNICKESKTEMSFYKYKGKCLSKCKECSKLYVKIRSKIPGTGSYIQRKKWMKQRQAKNRNIEFNLSTEEFKTVRSAEKCTYCTKNMDIVTIDRVNPEKGYVLGNVVAACKTCNLKKNNLGIKDICFLKNVLIELEKISKLD